MKEKETADSGFSKFWAELKRRKVMRVAITYAVVAWLIIQIAVSTFPSLYIPPWALTFVIMCVLLGFPVALILAWAFEITPEGIKATKTAQERTEVSKAHAKKRNWMAYAVGALLPTVIFGALALFFNIRFGDVTQETDENRSIAVLPLENLSPDSENAFFASGIHEDILTHLSRINSLKVIARTSMLRYAGTTKSMKKIGEELGVRFLLEGSVRKVDNRVKVTVQLIDAAEGFHIWANDYDRTLEDVFAIQKEIASEVVRELVGAISPEEQRLLDKVPTDNLVAYENFTKARDLEIQYGYRFRLEQIEFLEKAVEEDPLFVEAWVSLANAYLGNKTEEYNRAVRVAQVLAPDNPSVFHENLFYLVRVEREWELAHQACKQALEKWPQDPKLNLLYAVILDAMDREDEALVYHKKYIELDPFSFRSNNYISRSYYYNHGDIDNALIHIDRMREGWDDIQRFHYLMWQFYRTRDLDLIAEMENHFDDSLWINTARWLKVRFGLIKDLPGGEDSLNELNLDSINAFLPFMHYLEGNAELANEKAIEILNSLGVERNEVAWDSLREIPISRDDSNRENRLRQLDRYYRSHVTLLLTLVGWSESGKSILKRVEQEENELYDITTVHDYRYFYLQLLSWIDTEAAVDLLFDPQANHNLLKRKWELATDYLLNQKLLKHPRVIEMMVQDGDWIDFLAERIPEYEKYRNP